MRNRDHCPDTAVLVRWNAGSLPIEQFETVSDHLEACPTCQQTLDQLEDLSFVIDQQLAGITTADLERARQAIAADQSTVHAVSSWLSGLRSKHDELFEPALRVPCELREYEVQRLLGHGGMGEVYEARHKRLKRPVALKVMRSTRQNDPLAQAHFLREIETAGQFDHPNLVRAYDAWEQDGYVFLAQELLDGDSLRTLAADGKISGTLEIVDWLIGICLGVEQLHARGFLHRDIKPSNVMRLRDGSIKLIDYGLAISTDLDASSLAHRAGTVGYMAPEQAAGVGLIDQRCDLYSVGCVLKYLLRHLRHEILGESDLRLRNELAILADQMTRTLPEDRPDSIISVRQRLEELRQQAGTLAKSEANGHAKLPGKAVDSNAGDSEAVARKAAGSLSFSTRLLGLLMLVAIVAAALVIYLPRTKPASSGSGLSAQPEKARGKTPPALEKLTRSDVAAAAEMAPEIEQTPHSRLETKPSVTENEGPQPAIAPFDAKEAQQLQLSWSRYLDSPVEVINSVGIELRLIPPGTFTMGSAAGEEDEVVHEVTLTKAFYLGVIEVTQEQYERVMGTNPAAFKQALHPVEMVSWDDATEFCRRLSELPGEKAAGRFYRLPTEAEWEYACRAGTTTEYSFGDDASQLGDYGWFIANSDSKTQPVGQKQPNPWGLYDMHGNVWEWCEDWYVYFEPLPVTDPSSPETGSTRVFRGGCWRHGETLCRSSDRIGDDPSRGIDVYGFRVAMSVSSSR